MRRKHAPQGQGGGNMLWGIGWVRLGEVKLANALLIKRGFVGTDEGETCLAG